MESAALSGTFCFYGGNFKVLEIHCVFFKKIWPRKSNSFFMISTIIDCIFCFHKSKAFF